jgi:hypothetical protein
MGRTFEIFCRRGFNRVTCKFKKQDPQLNCAICNFAGFNERISQQKEEKTEENKNEQR